VARVVGTDIGQNWAGALIRALNDPGRLPLAARRAAAETIDTHVELPYRSVRMPANRHAAPGRAGGWMDGPCVSGERHERPHRLVLDAQASAMRPAPNSPVWFLPKATQRRFRLTAGCPLAGPPGDDELRLGRGLRASRSHSRPVVHESASPFVVA